MGIGLPTLERKDRLQRNLCGSLDYACVTCILLLNNGYTPLAISDCFGINTFTVYHYRSSYFYGCVVKLLGRRHKVYWELLDSRQFSVFSKKFREYVYIESNSLAQWIKETFGVEYASQGVVDLLNRIGFTYKKITEVSCKADAVFQEKFVQELVNIFSMGDKNVFVYYADSVYPMHNSHSVYAWIWRVKKLEQLAVSDRDRVNINSLVNARDVTDLIAFDCVSVNVESTRQFYQMVLDRHPDLSEIYIISENA